jgi:hypothetical protein
MRPHIFLLAVFALSACAFGQNRGGTPVLTGGVGNAVFPAGTPANSPGVTRFTPNAVYPAGGGPRLVVPGQPPRRYTGTGPGVIAVPFAYPIYVGGYYDAPQAPAAPPPPQQAASPTIIYPQQAPPVIVSQYGTPNERRDAQDPDNPEPVSIDAPRQADDQNTPDHYLIALKDHTVYSVVAYWVDGDTLHYFTAGNVHNQVSLSLVDRPLTTRLSKETGSEVKLPAEQQQ